MGNGLTPRAREIAATARRMLETDGAGALTMRRLAGELGIRAPSLYKHLADKAAVESVMIAAGFEEIAEVLEAAVEANPVGALAAMGAAYRQFALAHPHLYRLMNEHPLDRERLPAGLEDRAAAPIRRAAGSEARAQAAWAFAHGMVLLELNGRFPPGADLDAAWAAGLTAFDGEPASPPSSRSAAPRRSPALRARPTVNDEPCATPRTEHRDRQRVTDPPCPS